MWKRIYNWETHMKRMVLTEKVHILSAGLDEGSADVFSDTKVVFGPFLGDSYTQSTGGHVDT